MASGDTLGVFYAWGGSLASNSVSGTYQNPYLTVIKATQRATPVASFDDTNPEYLDYVGIMPGNYDSGGITCTVVYTHSNNTSAPVWNIAFRRLENNVDDLDASHVYDYNSGSGIVPDTVNKPDYIDVTFTDGADMDNVVAGDFFNLRITRDVATGGTGDAKMLAIHVQET